MECEPAITASFLFYKNTHNKQPICVVFYVGRKRYLNGYRLNLCILDVISFNRSVTMAITFPGISTNANGQRWFISPSSCSKAIISEIVINYL